MPSAGAICNATEGCAWIDVCDTDILYANGDLPVGCARISAKKDRVEFGSRSFDGASNRDVYIIRNNQVVGKFDNNGLTVYGTITSTGGFSTNSALRATK
ncbi:hypothetical protein [Cupriavidus campinensis]|uniref:Uncharacterized protein n=1 Tax=Cupriavidus campinensis TaxID=151783 RepID=A0AAE9HYA3_9BURK|nr:hypothetical protein [Cupriavidus campinensis]URF02780.1 hypothetical protein M5D45_09355 [Cupriavidus campinensis]